MDSVRLNHALLILFGRWCDVESDATNTLILAIDNLQALFRRSLARLKLHKLDMARDGKNTSSDPKSKSN